uniref:Mediator of RNA polymerase II transcription subunit 1 n=2 Tax=Petromyzon marinus TaxID=7757 RepID=A0AAJ7SWZ4_PETMA|nr:mediator of RNA polymerase II transcription subunit 1-like isoform X1 [Petromyzon marinus]
MAASLEVCAVLGSLGGGGGGGGVRGASDGGGGGTGSDPGCAAGEEEMKATQLNALMERLRAKHAQPRPWGDTIKMVRQAMERRPGNDSQQRVLRCLQTVQKALKVTSHSAMVSRLEVIAREHRLSWHCNPSNYECYVSSDMFYMVIHADGAGAVADVKVAHHGENPVSCPGLTKILREGNFEEFSQHLDALANLYNLPGDSDLKNKMYLALQSLELDLFKMAQWYKLATNAETVEAILHGNVGFVSPRSGENLMTLKYYVSPYDLLDEKTGGMLTLTDDNVPRSLGLGVTVAVEGVSGTHRLPIAPLIVGTRATDDKGTPQFASVSQANSVELPGCFFLKFPAPVPVSEATVKQLQLLTGVNVDPVGERDHMFVLIRRCALDKVPSGGSTADSNVSGGAGDASYHTVTLPDQKHDYFLNVGMEGATATADLGGVAAPETRGVLVAKIPFVHPSQVPAVLAAVRRQALYNALLASCMRGDAAPRCGEELSGRIQFEVNPLTHTSFTVSFQHPKHDTLLSVLVEVSEEAQVSAKLFTSPADGPFCTDDYLSRVVQRCASLPVTMRAVYKKAETAPVNPARPSNTAETRRALAALASNLDATLEELHRSHPAAAAATAAPPADAQRHHQQQRAHLTAAAAFAQVQDGLGGTAYGDGQAAGTAAGLSSAAAAAQQHGVGLSSPAAAAFSVGNLGGASHHLDSEFCKVAQNPILTSLLIPGAHGSGGGGAGVTVSGGSLGPPGAGGPASQTPTTPVTPTALASPSSTKAHPMLMTLLRDSPAGEGSTLLLAAPASAPSSAASSTMATSVMYGGGGGGGGAGGGQMHHHGQLHQHTPYHHHHHQQQHHHHHHGGGAGGMGVDSSSPPLHWKPRKKKRSSKSPRDPQSEDEFQKELSAVEGDECPVIGGSGVLEGSPMGAPPPLPPQMQPPSLQQQQQHLPGSAQQSHHHGMLGHVHVASDASSILEQDLGSILSEIQWPHGGQQSGMGGPEGGGGVGPGGRRPSLADDPCGSPVDPELLFGVPSSTAMADFDSPLNANVFTPDSDDSLPDLLMEGNLQPKAGKAGQGVDPYTPFPGASGGEQAPFAADVAGSRARAETESSETPGQAAGKIGGGGGSGSGGLGAPTSVAEYMQSAFPLFSTVEVASVKVAGASGPARDREQRGERERDDTPKGVKRERDPSERPRKDKPPKKKKRDRGDGEWRLGSSLASSGGSSSSVSHHVRSQTPPASTAPLKITIQVSTKKVTLGGQSSSSGSSGGGGSGGGGGGSGGGGSVGSSLTATGKSSSSASVVASPSRQSTQFVGKIKNNKTGSSSGAPMLKPWSTHGSSGTNSGGTSGGSGGFQKSGVSSQPHVTRPVHNNTIRIKTPPKPPPLASGLSSKPSGSPSHSRLVPGSAADRQHMVKGPPGAPPPMKLKTPGSGGPPMSGGGSGGMGSHFRGYKMGPSHPRNVQGGVSGSSSGHGLSGSGPGSMSASRAGSGGPAPGFKVSSPTVSAPGSVSSLPSKTGRSPSHRSSLTAVIDKLNHKVSTTGHGDEVVQPPPRERMQGPGAGQSGPPKSHPQQQAAFDEACKRDRDTKVGGAPQDGPRARPDEARSSPASAAIGGVGRSEGGGSSPANFKHKLVTAGGSGGGGGGGISVSKGDDTGPSRLSASAQGGWGHDVTGSGVTRVPTPVSASSTPKAAEPPASCAAGDSNSQVSGGGGGGLSRSQQASGLSHSLGGGSMGSGGGNIGSDSPSSEDDSVILIGGFPSAERQHGKGKHRKELAKSGADSITTGMGSSKSPAVYDQALPGSVQATPTSPEVIAIDLMDEALIGSSR